jgi:hypothetical protein
MSRSVAVCTGDGIDVTGSPIPASGVVSTTVTVKDVPDCAVEGC